MPEKPNILVQLKNRPTVLPGIQQPIVDFTKYPQITWCLMEPRAIERDPMVMVVASDAETGSIVFQVQLQTYLKSAVMLLETAKNEGWIYSEKGDDLVSARLMKQTLAAQLKEILDEWVDDDE